MSAIGDRLRDERERLGKNQDEFGLIGGVKRNAQANYERGDRSPDAEYFAAIAEGGVDVLYILVGQRKPTATESLSQIESDLIAKYRGLPEADQAVVCRLVEVAHFSAQHEH